MENLTSESFELLCCSISFKNTVVGVRFNLVMSALMEQSSSFRMELEGSLCVGLA